MGEVRQTFIEAGLCYTHVCGLKLSVSKHRRMANISAMTKGNLCRIALPSSIKDLDPHVRTEEGRKGSLVLH